MEMWEKWFPKLTDIEEAMKQCKQGAIGILVFAGMYLLGIAFAIYFSVSPTDGDSLSEQAVQDQVIGSGILLPIILFLAYRVYSGKGWFAAGLVLVWFVAETSLKVISGTSNVGWVIMYLAVAFMMVNGARGCWWVRGNATGADTTDEED